VEKMVFLFRRKDGMSREAFREHYVTSHSPLGLRNCLLLDGYVVNLVLSDAEYDSVTMLWSASFADFMDISKAYAKPEDLEEILADEQTFFDPRRRPMFTVEERVVFGDDVDPSGLTGGKVVSVHAVGEALPAVPDDATRVVDNVVRDAQASEPDIMAFASGVGVFREVWLREPRAVSSGGPDEFVVDERRWRETPALASPALA